MITESSKNGVKGKSKNDFYLTVYDLIKEGKNPAKICRILNVSKQALNWYIKYLSSNGYIKKIPGYGVWEVSKSFVNVGTDTPPDIGGSVGGSVVRGHAFMFGLAFRKEDNWFKKGEFLGRSKLKFVFSKRNKGYKLKLDEWVVWLYEDSIILSTVAGKSFCESTAKEAKDKALLECVEVVKWLGHRLVVDFWWGGGFPLRVLRQHYADVDNGLAKLYNKKGVRKLEVVDGRGKWLLVDNSFNLNELETVHKETAVRDMDSVVKPFFNDLKEFFEKSGEPLKLSELVGAVGFFSLHIKKHFEVLDKMSVTMDKIQESLEKVKK